MTRNKGRRLNLYIKDYVVFDLETTGLSPETDQIIEISGVRVREKQVAEKFSTLVNPDIPIPFAATRVNGITDKMVESAPDLRAALGDFLDFAGKDILVGHNIHTFDMNFLYASALRELDKKVRNDYVDTLYMAKDCLPQLSHHRLTDVASYFQIETKGAHRALNDCIMNQQCYEKLGEIWEEKLGSQQLQNSEKIRNASEAPVCPECGCILKKRKGRFGEFLGCSGFPMCRYTRSV